jgi:hypothetical protein
MNRFCPVNPDPLKQMACVDLFCQFERFIPPAFPLDDGTLKDAPRVV